MAKSSAARIFQDFVQLRDQASRISKDQSRLSLWIACTDHDMDCVLERIAKEGSALLLRQPKFQVPSSKADFRNELSAINFAVERLGVQDIVLCGHSLCSWCTEGQPKANQTPPSGNIDSLLQRVNLRQAMNEALRKELIHQLQILKSYPSVKNAIRSGGLRTHGLFYFAESGTFSSYDQRSHRFVYCDHKPEV
jgi:carbonic anhydrase